MVASEMVRRHGVIEVIRVLVLLQGAFLVTATLEAALFGGALGGAPGPALITAAATIATFVTLTGLGRRARWARRLTLAAEAGILLSAVLDLVLALALARAPLPLVSVLTRLVLPGAVMAVLLRRSVEEAFTSGEVRGRPSEIAVRRGGSVK